MSTITRSSNNKSNTKMTESKVFKRTGVLTDRITHYCPGCGHGIAHRLVAEVIEQLGVRGAHSMRGPGGMCGVGLRLHRRRHVRGGAWPGPGRGHRRQAARPDMVVFTYQGDGDLAAIGTAEIVHAANRGENITVIFVNNAVYGMTGGQMAPTTLVGQKTTTSPAGRSMASEGGPIKVCEMLSALDGPSYLARVTVNKPGAVRKAKQAVLTAFTRQIEGKGFSLVEILSPCPTYWRKKPADAMTAIDEWMVKTFPLGVYKDKEAPRGEKGSS